MFKANRIVNGRAPAAQADTQTGFVILGDQFIRKEKGENDEYWYYFFHGLSFHRQNENNASKV